MSLENILTHIIEQAKQGAQSIIQKAQKEAEAIIQETSKEAQGICRDFIAKEKSACESQKQKLMVNARLEYKKGLLCVKQELMEKVFAHLKKDLGETGAKKQRVSWGKTQEVSEDIDFYLKNIRADFESEIAQILFK